jgi:2-dehydro-3-deoxyphosphogluconate aldolase/(4S)-4-hydroxy-2-oxoglutarate aldolase
MKIRSNDEIMAPEIVSKIKEAGVVATLVVDELKHAVPLAKALVNGGVNIIELTLRTPVAMDAAIDIMEGVPEATVGFGTAITRDQIKQAAKIGVDFAVAPGCNPGILEAALEEGLSFAPGIMTPSDIEVALEYGCRMLKFFPSETSGGMKHLNSMAAPYKHLGLQFLPLGGINLENAPSYLNSPLIAAIGGSWIAKPAMINAEDWMGITNNAREIRTLIDQLRSNTNQL